MRRIALTALAAATLLTTAAASVPQHYKRPVQITMNITSAEWYSARCHVMHRGPAPSGEGKVYRVWAAGGCLKPVLGTPTKTGQAVSAGSKKGYKRPVEIIMTVSGKVSYVDRCHVMRKHGDQYTAGGCKKPVRVDT